MPFTPFHIGPALTLGYFLRRRLHFPTFIIANIIMDVEPLVVIVFSIRGYPWHGYLHTFLSAAVFGSILGLVFYSAGRFLRRSFEYLALVEGKDYSILKHVAAGVSGWSIHILLDAPLYSEIKPLYPISVNPLYNPNLDLAIGHLCVILIFAGSSLYLRSLYRSLSSRAGNRVAGVCTGLMATVLGLLSLTTVFFNPVYVFPSIGLIFSGLLLFYVSLRRLEPLMENRIVASEVTMLLSASLFSILMLRVFVFSIPLEQFIVELAFSSLAPTILFSSSWLISLISIVLLRPVFHCFSGDGSFKLLVDLLIAGWVLIPILIGALMVLVIIIIMLLRMPIILAARYAPEQK